MRRYLLLLALLSVCCFGWAQQKQVQYNAYCEVTVGNSGMDQFVQITFDFDQQQFAEQTGTSKSTLYKKLKTLTGMNTSAFIRSIRMKTACEVLEKNPTIRISDLAYSVGYNDPKYFSSCFKKDFGMLPSEYVKN